MIASSSERGRATACGTRPNGNSTAASRNTVHVRLGISHFPDTTLRFDMGDLTVVPWFSARSICVGIVDVGPERRKQAEICPFRRCLSPRFVWFELSLYRAPGSSGPIARHTGRATFVSGRPDLCTDSPTIGAERVRCFPQRLGASWRHTSGWTRHAFGFVSE